MLLNIRLKIIDWYKRNKRKVYIILVGWFVLVFINYLFGLLKGDPIPITLYEPHVSIMDDTLEVPRRLQEPINELFQTYFDYCNTGNFEAAYDMLSEGCKKYTFPTYEEFEMYAKGVFNTKKIYNIQNYSITDNIYIYNFRILDDVLATGTTGQENVLYYEEKAVVEEINGKVYLSIGGYVTEKDLDTLYEDEQMKITITKVTKFDEYEEYTINISNKTDYYILISDGSYYDEILLNIGSDLRNIKRDIIEPIVLRPGEKNTFKCKFTKFYDEKDKSESIVFNTVYVLKNYLYGEMDDEKIKEMKDNAIDSYSFNLPIQ